MKKSTVNLILVIIWGLCTLAWLPYGDNMIWPRIILPMLAVVNCAFQLSQYFKNRKEERTK